MSLTNYKHSNYSFQPGMGPNYRSWTMDFHPSASIIANATQQKMSTLVAKTLIPLRANDGARELKSHFNQEYTWEVSRIQALMNQVMSTGIITTHDRPKLGQIKRSLQQLQSELMQNKVLTQEEVRQAKAAIAEAQNLVGQAGDLFKYLKSYQKQAHKLEKSTGNFIDACYDPEEGKPLKGFPLLQTIFDISRSIGDALHPLTDDAHVDTAAGVHMLSLYNQQLKENVTLLEDWSDAVVAHVQGELNTLHALTKHTEPSVRHSAHAQMTALREHLKTLRQQGEDMRTRVVEWQSKWGSSENECVASIHDSMTAVVEHFEELDGRLTSFINGFDRQLDGVNPSELPQLSYGTKEWDEHVDTRPPQPKSWLGSLWNKTCSFLNPLGYIPEKWRPSSLQIKSMFLLALSSGEQIHKYSKISEQAAHLRVHADRLQREVFSAVPTSTAEIINEEVARIGKALGDHYGALCDKSKNPEGRTALDRFVKKVPNARSTLEKVIEKFGNGKPTDKQIEVIMNAHYMQRMVQASPTANPFKSYSISEWWQILTKPEQTFRAASPEEMPPPMTSAAAAVDGLVPSMIKSLGKLFGAINIFAKTDEFPKAAHVEGYQALKGAMDSTLALQNTLKATPQLTALQEEANVLHQQLLHAVAETPEAQCSLPKLALWSQHVEDVCHALKDIEGRVARTMEAARQQLETPPLGAQTDAELERYGKKHMNLVKEARLVRAINIPGVVVPIPQGISSDRVTEFLLKEAPEVFKQWKELGILHRKYADKSKPFLETPEATVHLKAIDDALRKAFERAAANSEFLPAEFLAELDAIESQGAHLMVRSTGSEDSRQTANAGGNLSKAYVPPEKGAVTRAIGEVVRSYFGYASLLKSIEC